MAQPSSRSNTSASVVLFIKMVKPDKAERAAAAKDWCFTLNHPTQSDVDKLDESDHRYLIYSLENGSAEKDNWKFFVFNDDIFVCHTPHLQGFIQMESKVRLTALKKLSHAAHWEKRRGTAFEADHYCRKPVHGCDCGMCTQEAHLPTHLDGPYEHGTLSLGDNAQKMSTVARVIKAKGLTHAIERFPEVYMQFPHGMDKLASHFSLERDFVTEVTVCFGKSGMGKTYYAREGPVAYILPMVGRNQTDFFGHYKNDVHDTLIVDDFYSNWKFKTFLSITDCHPYEVQTKGGFIQFLCHNVIFTSNKNPNTWYANVMLDPDRVESFTRRIHNIIEFTSHGIIVRKGKLPWPILPWQKMATVVDVLMPQALVASPGGSVDPSSTNTIRDVYAYSNEEFNKRYQWFKKHRQ